MKSINLELKIDQLHKEIVDAIVKEFTETELTIIDTSDLNADGTPKIMDPFEAEFFENIFIDEIRVNGVLLDNGTAVDWSEVIVLQDLISILKFLETFNQNK